MRIGFRSSALQRSRRRSAFARTAGLLLLGAPALAFAQTGTVVGTITDRGTGQPIEAVRAQVGPNLVALSDARGRFVIRNVPVGSQTVRVTRIGFRPDTRLLVIAANDTARVSFEASPSAVELDQVVVTGTGGAVDKKKIGSSMGVVDMVQLQEQMPVTDIGSALASKVAGLRSVSVGGGAGAAKDLRIRGIASFSLNQRPVVYIDNVRVDTKATEWTNASGIVGKLA